MGGEGASLHPALAAVRPCASAWMPPSASSRSLDEQRAREVARSLRKRNAAAVAVCFMHAFMNGANDRHMKAVLEEELPGLPVTTRSYGRTWVMAA